MRASCCESLPLRHGRLRGVGFPVVLFQRDIFRREFTPSVSVCNCFLLADSALAIYALQFVTDEIVIILMHPLGLSCFRIPRETQPEREKERTSPLISRKDKLHVKLPEESSEIAFQFVLNCLVFPYERLGISNEVKYNAAE